MNIIGNKSRFAIEYKVNEIHPYIMGHIRLWLNNSYIGFFEEEVMLETSLGPLIELIGDSKKSRLQKLLIPKEMDDNELFNYLKNDEGDLKDHTMFSVDESTDDFLVYVYKDKEKMKFLWQLHRSPSGKYKNYPMCVFSTCVDFLELKNIVNEFDKKLSVL